MRRHKAAFAAMLAAVVILAAFVSCGTAEGTDTPRLATTVGEMETGMEKFTLNTADSTVVLEIVDGLPQITSLSTKESGENMAAAGSAIAMPSYYGAATCDKTFAWKYEGYKTYSDERGGTGYALCFRDAESGIGYELYAIAREALAGPFEFLGYLVNDTDAPIEYKPDEYFSFSAQGGSNPTAWTFNKEGGMAEGAVIFSSQYYGGTGIYKEPFVKGRAATAYARTNQNWNDSGDIPMMYIDYGANGLYYALEWSNGKLTAKSENCAGDVDMNVKLAQGDFITTVPAGERLYMPSVYLGVYDGDVDDGSNVFKRWFLNCKAPESMLENPDEPLTQQDMQLGIDVAQYGIQSIKWDYGWWSDDSVGTQSAEANFVTKANEGLLEVRNSAYLNVIKSVGASDLAGFVKKANDAGVKLATYILLKDTQLDRSGVPTSVGKDGHPEWFSDVNITGVANSADLGNEDCVAFYKKYMLDFFKKNGVTTWRSDFEPICRSSDKANRHDANGTDVQYWCTVGFRDLVDYLDANLDDFRYESCCSGGAMKDFFTMTRAQVINCDDSADYMSLHMSFYDSSYCVHPAQLQLPCNALTYTSGSANYMPPADYVYGLRCVLTGGVMLSNWTGTTEQDKSYWPHYIKDLYNTKMKPIIKYGDLYHILPRPDGVNWDGLEYADANGGNELKALVMLWKPSDTEGSEKTVKLRGLNAGTLYKLTFEDRPEQNCEKTGAELMDDGLTVTIAETVGSEMIWITEK